MCNAPHDRRCKTTLAVTHSAVGLEMAFRLSRSSASVPEIGRWEQLPCDSVITHLPMLRYERRPLTPEEMAQRVGEWLGDQLGSW